MVCAARYPRTMGGGYVSTGAGVFHAPGITVTGSPMSDGNSPIGQNDVIHMAAIFGPPPYNYVLAPGISKRRHRISDARLSRGENIYGEEQPILS